MKKVVKTIAILYYGFINLIFVMAIISSTQSSQVTSPTNGGVTTTQTVIPNLGIFILVWIIFNLAGLLFIPMMNIWE